MKRFLSFVCLKFFAGATLTNNGIVTADSVSADPNTSIQGVIDEKFPPKTAVEGHKCGQSGLSATSTTSWINVQLQSVSVVETVVLINYDDYAADNFQGTDISVGFDPNASKNSRCSINPIRTGVGSCGGLSGLYIGIFRTMKKEIRLCQIRAYSWKFNQGMFITTSSPASFGSKEKVLSVKAGITGNEMFVTEQTPCFWKMTFEEQRFIQAVVMIGHFFNDYSETVGFQLFYISPENDEIRVEDYFDEPSRRYGKEMRIQQFGNGIIFKKNVIKMSFRFIGVFTTMTDCSQNPTFEWIENPVPTRIPLGTSGSVEIYAKANDGDCPLSHHVTINDIIVQTDEFSYDYKEKKMKFSPFRKERVGTYILKVNAVLVDGFIEPIIQIKTYTVTIFCATELKMDANTAYSEKRWENNGSPTSFDLPTFLPTPDDALLDLEYTLNSLPAGSILSIHDKNKLLISDPTATPQAISVQVTVTDKLSGLKKNFDFLLTIFQCKPINFRLDPPIVDIITTRAKKEVKLSWDPPVPDCGKYDHVIQTSQPGVQYIKRSTSINKPDVYEIEAPFTSKDGYFNIIFTLENQGKENVNAQATLTLTVTECFKYGVFIEPIPTSTFICEDEAKTIQIELEQDETYCIEEITYKLEPYFSVPIPSWLTLQATDNSKIVVSGTQKTDVGNDTYKVRATGKLTGDTDTQTFDINLVDCTIKNFSVTPSAISISQLGPAKSIQATIDPPHPVCNSLSERFFDTPPDSQLVVAPLNSQTNSFTIKVETTLGQPLGSTWIDMIWGFKNKPSYEKIQRVFVAVTRCEVLSLSQSRSQSTSFYLIGSSFKDVPLPTFTQTPNCKQTMTYQASSTSPFFSFSEDSSQINLSGSDVNKAGPFKIAVTGATSFKDLKETHTISVDAIDCTPKGMIALPSSVTVSQLGGPSEPIVLSKNSPNPECGTYLYSIEQLSFVSMLSNSITITAGLEDKVGFYQVKVTDTNSKVPLKAEILVPVTITPCVIKSMNKLSKIVANLPTKFIIGGPALPVTMPSYSQTPDCKYKLLFKDINQNFEFAQQNEKWLISVKSSAINGPQSIRMRAYFDETPIYDDFTSVEIECVKVQCSPPLPFTYLISSSGQRKTVSMVDQQSLLLSPEITLSQLQFRINLVGGQPLPVWITFDPLKATFSIEVTDKTLAGEFSIQIEITANEVHPGWSCKIESFQVILKPDSEVNQSIPVINKLVLRPPLNDQEIRTSNFWSYPVPQAGYLIQEETNKSNKVTLSIKTSQSLIQLDTATNTLILSRAIENQDTEKSVIVTYSLAETEGLLTAEFTQIIVLKALEIIEQPQNSTMSNIAEIVVPKKQPYEENPFKPFDPWQFYKQTVQQNVTIVQTEQKKSRPLSIGVKSISQTGIITIQFSEPLVIPMEYLRKSKINTAQESNNSTAKDVRGLKSIDSAIQVRIIPGQESDEKNLTYIWNVTEFNELNMQIKVNFTYAKYVSIYNDLDQVQVIIFDPNAFQAQSGARLEKPLSLFQPFPRQIQPDGPVAQIAQVATQGAAGVKSFVIGNVILSTVLSTSLSQLFSMVEAQQIVCLITCSQISLPPLPAVIITQFFQIANFDILNVGYVYEKIFFMPTLPALNANFAAVGFNDTYFINNLGSILISIIGFLGLQALALLAKKLKKKSNYFKAQWINLQPTCFWNMPIRVILSSYSILSLSALMALQKPRWKYPGPIIDTVLSFFGLALSLIFPIWVLYIMFQHFQKFQTRQFKSSFGSLYEDLDPLNKWIIAFRVWFIVRRLLLSIIVVYIKNLIAQIMLWFLQELISLYILGYGYPFKLHSQWAGEMQNEAFILTAIYFIMFFSPYISNVDVLNGIGYFFCGFLFSHLLINITVIAIFTIRQKIQEFKHWWHIRREKKRVKVYNESKNIKQMELNQSKSLRRRHSIKFNNAELINALEGDGTRRRWYEKSQNLSEEEQRVLRAPQLLLNPNRIVKKTSILLEEIKEMAESSQSSYSDGSEDESIQVEDLDDEMEEMEEMEEIKCEESMTLNQIEEEDVAIKPILRLGLNQQTKESKLENISPLIISQRKIQEEVFSEQAQDREILLRVVSESNRTPFKSLRQSPERLEPQVEFLMNIHSKKSLINSVNQSNVTQEDYKKKKFI